MTELEMRRFIMDAILARYSTVAGDRTESLADVLGVLLPREDKETVRQAANMAPALPVSIYRRWTGLFVDRVLETVPHDQVADLCRGTKESNATLALVYVMFMESDRMEKIVSEDLKNLGFASREEGEAASLVGAWLRFRMTSAGNGGAS